jgi:hypothetical protein
MRMTLVSVFAALMLLAAPAAIACAPVTVTDPNTGESYASGSPKDLRRIQEGWRQRSKVVVIAQVRSGQMTSSSNIEYTLAPVVTVYGGDLPKSDLQILWTPGSSCNTFDVGLSIALIVFVGSDDDVIGFTTPKFLQDSPSNLDDELRKLRRSNW